MRGELRICPTGGSIYIERGRSGGRSCSEAMKKQKQHDKMKSEISDTLLFKFFMGGDDQRRDRPDCGVAGSESGGASEIHGPDPRTVRHERDERAGHRSGSGPEPALPDHALASGAFGRGSCRRFAGDRKGAVIAFFPCELTACRAPRRRSRPRRANISRIALSDGTSVELNSKSRITYPALFIGRERRVRLEGEAMFDVRHDADHPSSWRPTRATWRCLARASTCLPRSRSGRSRRRCSKGGSRSRTRCTTNGC